MNEIRLYPGLSIQLFILDCESLARFSYVIKSIHKTYWFSANTKCVYFDNDLGKLWESAPILHTFNWTSFKCKPSILVTLSISDCESLTELDILNAYEYNAIMQNPKMFLGKLRNEHLFYKRSTEHHSHTVPVKVNFLKYPTLNIDDKTKQLFESEI